MAPRTSRQLNNEAEAIDAQRAKVSLEDGIFREEMAPGMVLELTLNKVHHSTRSQFQQIDVIESNFGRTLITDGKTQSAEFDEFAYHEILVHPALLRFAHATGRAPKSIFIGGGGELATAREALRHKDVERVVMVDLDEKVVDVSVKYLPEWGGETVKSDPRLDLIIGDAYAYLLNTEETFDVIIMDISDPIEAGPGVMLYTKELYEHAATRLSPSGVFVTQAGTADAVPSNIKMHGSNEDISCFAPIRNTLMQAFKCSVPYTQSIPSFGSDWGFVMAFNPQSSEVPSDVIEDFIGLSPKTVDNLINRYVEGGEDILRMYDGTTHRRMFNLPKAVRKQLSLDKRVMTRDNPIFMY